LLSSIEEPKAGTVKGLYCHSNVVVVAVATCCRDVVAAFLRRRGRTIAVDDGHIEKIGLMEPQYHDRENDIETTVGMPSSKGAINTGIMDFREPSRVLCYRQFLPLTSYVQ
jgi:hypothetical protein